ncbi:MULTISPECIES: dihydrolipoamide acetyltransferase family protein [unclassified Clostridioides]|uniref:dihydrolipoamide acetyltransferase family protein n=1 Tax=unclassified Clostridioides TaxID=2635829 RepID=UPI0007BB7F85|nr:2-oxo acid dehydrogenase subunit E2 [Clostridioides sp. ZZV14-6387]MCI9976221.1 2-oxo acid dehydrogenase subunit E2 [Clostridioides difficile]MDI0266055.1 dihydrolipoamide acetyltransferase family protein [Clostridioides difficile]CZR98456.1 Dihydrolipoyllysine-residue acetyltransferase component of pyruvate dehydrogenase complex [Clostridioides difficile]CZS10530.1 Dihydrolipoyllysine-residue acetyltransferase component of pyruvate dehydrogenase complex [Clostridioides difficile]
MITEVKMPKFGLSMEDGTIGTWLIEEGTIVNKGDELLEIETDKITNTVEATEDGVLRKILFEEGEVVNCGEIICIIADANEDISGLNPTVKTNIEKEEDTPSLEQIIEVKNLEIEKRITPRAKKIAEEKGIDYSNIEGTGIHGAITIDDLKNFMNKNLEEKVIETNQSEVVEKGVRQDATSIPQIKSAKTTIRENDVVTKMTQMQNIIAKKMHESLLTTAQTTIATELEITNLTKVYKSLKEKYKNAGIKLSYTALIIKAVAQALENHPKLRTQVFDENHFKINDEINVGVAVDIPNGLVVPVIKNANLKDLRTICIELSDLSEKAKNNQLNQDEMSNGTITITNLGMFGITYFTPVLNTPESAILGIGSIIEKVLVKEGAFYAGSVMNMSLTHDHRVVDGAPGARFLQEVTQNLLDFRWM